MLWILRIITDLEHQRVLIRKILDLKKNNISSLGIEYFCNNNCVILYSLIELILDSNPIKNCGISVLASCMIFKSLKKLSLVNCGFNCSGVKSLCMSNYIERLIELDIMWNNIGKKGSELLENFKDKVKYNHID